MSEDITSFRATHPFHEVFSQQAADCKQWRRHSGRGVLRSGAGGSRRGQICAFSSNLDSKSSLRRASYLSIR
jgi:hypothetical protein